MAPWLYPSSHQSAPPVWLTSEARRWIKTDAVWPPSLEAAERPRQHQRVLSLGNAQGTVREQRHLCSFGLELRNPFRDRRLVEFMLAVPAYALEKGGWSKAVLRQAMKGRLPAEVLRRRGKSSFGDLYRRGMTEERRRWLWRRLRRPGALWAGLVDPAWLKRTLWGEVDSRHLLVLSRSVFLDAWARRAGLALSRTIPRTLVGDLS